MGQRHDHLFQVLFADPQHAAPLLRSALPTRIAERIFDAATLDDLFASGRG